MMTIPLILLGIGMAALLLFLIVAKPKNKRISMNYLLPLLIGIAAVLVSLEVQSVWGVALLPLLYLTIYFVPRPGQNRAVYVDR